MKPFCEQLDYWKNGFQNELEFYQFYSTLASASTISELSNEHYQKRHLCKTRYNGRISVSILIVFVKHTAYSRNIMDQTCEGNCGLWVLNEMIKKIYPEDMKKIMGAVWKLPAK